MRECVCVCVCVQWACMLTSGHRFVKTSHRDTMYRAEVTLLWICHEMVSDEVVKALNGIHSYKRQRLSLQITILSIRKTANYDASILYYIYEYKCLRTCGDYCVGRGWRWAESWEWWPSTPASLFPAKIQKTHELSMHIHYCNNICNTCRFQ